MKIFIWFMVILMLLDIGEKSVTLYKRDFIRKPFDIVWDIFFSACFVTWGAYVLGGA